MVSQVVEDALGQVDIGVLVVDDERRVLIANQALCDLATPGAGSLVGAPASIWAVLPSLAPFAVAMRDVRSVRAAMPDGQVRQGTWHAVPTGLMLTVRDVPPEQTRSELPTTRTELVSAVLHELRTPLTTLASAIDYLPEPDEETAPVYALIRRTADRMRDALAELASVADLESGGIALDESRVDLGRIVTETVAAWQRRDDVEVPVAAEVAGSAPLDGDAHWLRVMVDRLVALAVTAAAPGLPVTVTATGTPAGWTLRLPVDAGLASDRLFTRTGGQSNATALMLARAVLTRHHGRLTMSTRDGRQELCVTVPARSSGANSTTTQGDRLSA